jgi:hypothetical protein
MFLFEIILRFDFWIAFSNDILEAIDDLYDLSPIELRANPNDETGYSPYEFCFSCKLLESPNRTPCGGRQAFSRYLTKNSCIVGKRLKKF